MLKLKINKKLLDEHRIYNIKRLMGDNHKEDINYKVLEYIISNSNFTLQKLYEELLNYLEITICVNTFDIINRKSKQPNDIRTFKEFIQHNIDNGNIKTY